MGLRFIWLTPPERKIGQPRGKIAALQAAGLPRLPGRACRREEGGVLNRILELARTLRKSDRAGNRRSGRRITAQADVMREVEYVGQL